MVGRRLGNMKRWSHGVHVLKVSVVAKVAVWEALVEVDGFYLQGFPSGSVEYQNSPYKLHPIAPLYSVYSCAGTNDNTTKFCTSSSVVNAV